MKTSSLFFALLVGCTGPTEPIEQVPSDGSSEPEGFSYLMVDRATGEVLMGDDADRRRAPASTTKLMTALVVYDAIEAGEVDLHEYFYVDIEPRPDEDGDGSSDYDGTQAGFELGAFTSAQALLYGMLLPSGNDAAHILASQVLGGVDETVDRMNDLADDLGMHDTHYVNVHGRDPGDMLEALDCPQADAFDQPECAHHTTARDLTVLLEEVLDNSRLQRILESRLIVAGDLKLESTNALLPGGEFSFDPSSAGRVIGGKTGTTRRAGWCFVGAAERDDSEVMVALMGLPAEMDWAERWEHSSVLLDEALRAAR